MYELGTKMCFTNVSLSCQVARRNMPIIKHYSCSGIDNYPMLWDVTGSILLWYFYFMKWLDTQVL